MQAMVRDGCEVDNLLLCEVRMADDPDRGPGRLVGEVITYGVKARFRNERVMRRGVDLAGDWFGGECPTPTAWQPVVRVFPVLDGDTIRVDAVLPSTSAGRDAAENIRQKVYTGLSVEMLKAGLQATMVNGERQIRSARLAAIGLVDLAEYDTAVEVRESGLAVDRRHVYGWI